MATSESEDFESADEDFEPDKSASTTKPQDKQDSKQEVEEIASEPNRNAPEDKQISNDPIDSSDAVCTEPKIEPCVQDCEEKSSESITIDTKHTVSQQLQQSVSFTDEHIEGSKKIDICDKETIKSDEEEEEKGAKKNRHAVGGKQRQERQNKSRESKLGATKLSTKKLGTRVASPPKKDLDLQENSTAKEDKLKENSEESIDLPKTSDKQDSIQTFTADSKPKEEFSSVFDKLSNSSNSPEKKVLIISFNF